ncbi:hypothetical protein ACQBAU_04455 [Propionibacteriaceae bacterium Y2011]
MVVSDRVTRALLLALAAVMVVFTIVYVVHKVTARVPARILNLLHVNTEAAVPAWFNTALLLVAALLALFALVSAPRSERTGWLVLTILLTYLSVDEGAGEHETFGELAAKLPMLDVGTFFWVLPGAILALAGVAVVLLSCRRLPAPVRRPLLFALVLYGTGALGTEFVTGTLIRTFAGNFVVVDVVQPVLVMLEESLEMVACIVAIRCLLQLFERQPDRLDRLVDVVAPRA